MMNARNNSDRPELASVNVTDRRVSAASRLTALAIIRAVAAEFGLGVDAMMHRHMQRESRARQVAMFLARELLAMSYPQLGRVFRRDHTTVLQATRKIGELVLTDEVLALRIKNLRLRLSGTAQRLCCPACGQPVETPEDRRAVVEQLKQQMRALADQLATLEAATP